LLCSLSRSSAGTWSVGTKHIICVATYRMTLARFFKQKWTGASRQVCRPGAEQADKFVGLVRISVWLAWRLFYLLLCTYNTMRHKNSVLYQYPLTLRRVLKNGWVSQHLVGPGGPVFNLVHGGEIWEQTFLHHPRRCHCRRWKCLELESNFLIRVFRHLLG
jgi:hypothetical protein